MIVNVIELHKNGSKDDEGYMIDEQKMVLDSEPFLKYLDEFHVKEKYQAKNVSWTGEVHRHNGTVIARTEAYFNGWIKDEVTGKQEMCYIIIERPV